MKRVLITGGAGYIGSHTVVEFLNLGYQIVILDNFCNSKPKVLDRIEQITGVTPLCVTGDVGDAAVLESLFTKCNFDAVIHFAGLKSVGESVTKPLLYYQHNVAGAIALLDAMHKHRCFRLVFSSSATVYGDPKSVPIKENFPLSTTNPYGRSKLIIEDILRDLAISDKQWQISILRYFNPVAAHPSGLIGEDPSGIPNNLMPYIAQVAIGKLKQLAVFGDDYDTPDGTGVRDYIHVVDLACAHVKALQALHGKHGCRAYNIGTGNGFSVLQMIKAFEHASQVNIPYSIQARRTGDVAECYADVLLSRNTIDWQAKYGLAAMMEDHWRWQKNNPNGY